MKKKKQVTVPVIPVIILVVLLVAGFIIWKVSQSNNDSQPENSNTNDTTLKYVKVLDDTTKVNTSTKLSETKTFEGLAFSSLKLSEAEQISTLTGTITNNSDTVQNKRYFNCYMINENKDLQYVLTIYLKKDLNPGETTDFSAGITLDNVDIYDFYIDKYTEAQ